MRHSSFGALVLLLLLIAVVVLLLTPHQRHSPSSTAEVPRPLWGDRR
jgi:cbb3-type cytochrome oxidase subunit 3